MLLAKKIRINVSPRDAETLEFMQAKCRALYNWHLGQLKAGAKWSLYDAKKTLQQSRVIDPDINAVYGKLLHEVFFRLDEAMKAFFRRVKAGQAPGFPRYHARGKFFTLKYPGMYLRVEGHTLILPTGGRGKTKRLADIQARLTETPPTPFREVAITKDAEGHYYATFLSETQQFPLQADDGCAMAYDLGIKTLATGYSTTGRFLHIGGFTAYRWYNKQLDKIRSLRSRCQKGSRRYRYLTQVYHRVSEQKRRKQRDSLHKASAFLTRQAERAIVLGDLSQQPMVQKSQNVTKRTKGLHRSVQNEWGLYQFVQMVQYKAQRNGKKVYIISERYTSKDCSGCGTRQDMPLWKRTYHCPQCGLVMDRDDNAARNILARFLARLGPYSANLQNDVLSASSGI
ncbi:MAG: transposase [Firmicutes bacterium]|nr:transposase [Bacillota bacterium]